MTRKIDSHIIELVNVSKPEDGLPSPEVQKADESLAEPVKAKKKTRTKSKAK